MQFHQKYLTDVGASQPDSENTPLLPTAEQKDSSSVGILQRLVSKIQFIKPASNNSCAQEKITKAISNLNNQRLRAEKKADKAEANKCKAQLMYNDSIKKSTYLLLLSFSHHQQLQTRLYDNDRPLRQHIAQNMLCYYQEARANDHDATFYEKKAQKAEAAAEQARNKVARLESCINNKERMLAEMQETESHLEYSE